MCNVSVNASGGVTKTETVGGGVHNVSTVSGINASDEYRQCVAQNTIIDNPSGGSGMQKVDLILYDTPLDVVMTSFFK